MALNSRPSPRGDRPVPTKPRTSHVQPLLWVVQLIVQQKAGDWQADPQRLHPPLLPPMNSHHMVIQVANPGEGMICCRTPSNPTKIRPLFVRIISTIWLVLTPCLFDLETFVTEMDKRIRLQAPLNQPHVGPCGACTWTEH